jgi:hypothetical protein
LCLESELLISERIHCVGLWMDPMDFYMEQLKERERVMDVFSRCRKTVPNMK